MAFIPNGDFAEEFSKEDETLGNLASLADAARASCESFRSRFMPRSAAHFVVAEEQGEVRLYNTDYGAAIEEFGAPSRNTPAFAPLRRGVVSAGFRLDETEK